MAKKSYKPQDNELPQVNEPVAAYHVTTPNANLYVPTEYEQEIIDDKYAEFKLYHKKDDIPEKIRLNFVFKDGKLYIQNLSENDLVIANAENGVQILDEERPSLDAQDVDNFEYNLSRLDEKKNAGLPFREIWHMAMANIAALGKKQRFMVTILLSITTAKYVNDKVIDEAAIVTADSHCLKVNIENTDIFNEDEHMDMHEFINKYLNNKKYGDIICQNTSGMYIEGRTFTQIKSQDISLSDFSYIPYEHLDKNKLLYGRMPEKRNEVVLDKQLIDKVTEYTSAVSLMYDGYESYVGAKLHGSKIQGCWNK